MIATFSPPVPRPPVNPGTAYPADRPRRAPTHPAPAAPPVAAAPVCLPTHLTPEQRREVEPLRTHRNESGYRGVYRARHRWAAKVKRAGRLYDIGRADLPHQAALLVARWYAREYGPNWAAHLFGGGKDRRRRNSWEVKLSKSDGGWVVTVFELGKRVLLGPHLHPVWPRLDGRRVRPWAFPTADEAREYLRKWRARGMVRRWGLFAGSVLWR